MNARRRASGWWSAGAIAGRNRCRWILPTLLGALAAAAAGDAPRAVASPAEGPGHTRPDRVARFGRSGTGDRTVPAVLARFEFVAPRMGTLFKITLYAPDATVAEEAAHAAFARVAELNRIFSDYDAGSEAMRLCRAPPGVPVPVSADLFAVLRLSQELAKRSDGAFDVTIGSVVAQWREARRTRRLPTEAERSAALRAGGHANLRLDESARTATLLTPGLRLDFGGIAKGYAADAALAVLRVRGLPHAMVAASGDLALGEAPPAAPGWKVALEPFGRESRRPVTMVAANVGISTSGDAEQFVEIDGVRYSHIVDPRTGLGLTERVAVTVVAARSVSADSLATAGSVLAAVDEARFAACVGDVARALVLRRNREGKIVTTSYGSNPPGVRTGW